ncbi:MAG: ABC transporter substrate-binding protein [Gaiellaceae bacterium]
MHADLSRVACLLAFASVVVAAAGCSGVEQSVRIGLLTDCLSPFSSYEDAMLAGAELPLLERGARLTNGKPSGGVSGARVAGREIELVRGCTAAYEFAVNVDEVRRLVELEGVDAVIGPISDADGLVVRELARKHPQVIFVPAWSGAQELTLRHPAANVYRFDTDEAQDVAGLGSYAYRELGWRRAAVVVDPWLGWQEEAAFVAEFCALGGNVTARFSTPIDLSNPKVGHALDGADGVAALVFGGLFTGPEFLPALARALGQPETQIVVGTYVLEDSNTLVPIAGLPAGVVGASSIPPANSTPAMRRHRAAFSKAFPGLPPGFAETPVVLAFHAAMEGLLRGLEAAEGDLSDGRQRLREELARVRFDLPSSPVRLDRNRQAVRNVYLKRIGYENGKRAFRLVRVVPDVEQTFGGLLSNAPPPGPGSQPCRKGTPPPWAR